MALGILSLLGAAAWSLMLENASGLSDCLSGLTHLDVLVPEASWPLLWRRSPSAVLQGVVQLAALAFFYLALGAAVFRRRDV